MASDYLTAPFAGAVCLYALYDPRNGETRYIGKSVNPRKRYRRHQLSGQKPKPKSWCARWIAAVQRAGLEPQLRVLDWVEMACWRQAERHYIALARAAGARLTNRTLGGDGSLGCRPTKLARRRMSEAGKRSWAEDKTRRIRVTSKTRGRAVSDEERERKRQNTQNYWDSLPTEERQARVQRLRERNNEPASRERSGQALAARWREPEFRTKMIEHNSRQANDPIARAKNIAASKQYWAEPQHRQEASDALRARHYDPVWKARWLHARFPHKYPDPDEVEHGANKAGAGGSGECLPMG